MQVIFHPLLECLRTVAETPVLDDLRMSAETPELIICVDAHIPNRGADFFCVWSQKLRHWMICISYMFLLASLVQLV